MIKYNFAVLLAVFALTSSASAECVRGSEKGLQVKWKGFKTPAKVGVRGILRELKSEGPREAGTWQKLVLGQTLTIGTGEKSVDSNDKVRDAKLAKFFFGKLKGKHTIVAKVTQINEEESRLTLSVTMNGRTLDNVAMAYTFKDNVLEAKGYIDIFDFAGHKALKAINKACFAKHQGKTWSDVGIAFSAQFKACQ